MASQASLVSPVSKSGWVAGLAGAADAMPGASSAAVNRMASLDFRIIS